MGRRRFTAIVAICTVALGYSSCTLLKPCEGENLQDCVKKAESILQDTNMTFPDDNETLQSVCSMWDEMTGCAYNYTARCLTPKENLEFRSYFEPPMSSMRKICTDEELTREYFRHAHCIKTISTVDEYCGQQYQLLIAQILGITKNTMKRICCALTDFKDCVLQKDADHVCGNGPEHDHETDGDISSYALRTLDKSLLAFVAHSCTKEGFSRTTCLDQLEDQDASNEVDNGLGVRTAGPIEQASHTHAVTTPDFAMFMASTSGTQKTLLVPVQTSTVPPGGAPHPLHNRLHVNVSIAADKGKIMSSHPSGRGSPRENSVYKKEGLVVGDVVVGGASRGLTKSMSDVALNQLLEAKIRNVSDAWSLHSPPPRGKKKAQEGADPVAEKRIDMDASYSRNYLFAANVSDGKRGAAGNQSSSSNSSSSLSRNRATAGRALNIARAYSSSEEDGTPDGAPLEDAVHTGTVSQSSQTMSSTVSWSSGSPGMMNTSRPMKMPSLDKADTPVQTNNDSTTVVVTSSAGTERTTTTEEETKESRIMNHADGSSAAAAAATATTPTMTVGTTSPKPGLGDKMLETGTWTKNKMTETGNSVKNTIMETGNIGKDKIMEAANGSQHKFMEAANDGKNKIMEAANAKKKSLANLYNSTRAAGESKNKSHVSVSDVPIRVFMIWLSTFFV